MTRAITVGARPSDISAGAGGVWVANLDDDSVSKIDPRAARLARTWSTGKSVDGLTTTAHAVWTLDAADATLLRIDPAFGQVAERIHLGRPPAGSNTVPSPVATGTRSVWAANGFSAVARVAATSGELKSTVDVGNQPAGIAQGAGATWVADNLDDTVSQIDGAGRLANTIPVGHGASAIAVGDGGVWVADTVDATVTRLDPATGATTDTIRVGAGPTGIAVGPGAVWVANSVDGTVSRIDPRSDRVVATITVGGSPAHVVVAAGKVWVTVQTGSAPGAPAPAGTLRVVQQRDFNSTDPALLGSYGPQASQLAYATCARLLDYPDRPAPQGTRLAPEIAAAMPTVSANGRTYRYTVRSGFRFSSGQPVTGLAFKTAIERYLSPKMHDPGGIDFIFAGIVGYRAYEAGRARHLAGVSATDTTLTVRLLRPDPALPARLAIPSLCPVPPDTPISAKGIEGIPSTGPYYIAFHAPNRELVLRRNPFYHGPRPRRSAEIDYRFGSGPEANSALVESGRADYANATIGDQHFASSVSAATKARLAQRYGPGSPAARAGRQRYFSNRTITKQYLLLNSRRPLFATARMRRAVNFAVDRSALAATAGQGFSGLPTDQYLPAGMPGYRDADIYPLGRPNLARARRLAGHGRHHAVMYTCNRPACARVAEIVRADLRRIGIDVAIKPFALVPMFVHEFTRGAPFDIGWFGWALDFLDPSDFLGVPFNGSDVDFPGADAQRYKARLAAASRLTGEARLRAYGQLDIAIARNAAPVVAFADITADDFFSARIGCQVFQPIYGMDLGALCRRG